ncbi:Glutamate racemase [Bienertia sinuspersici]
MQNPLFLHLSDSATSIQIDKLQGASDYRSWKHDMEIQLTANRKFGFVTGKTAKDETDEVKAELWELCNNMVIAWIHNNVSPPIKKSIHYYTSVVDVWNHLEARLSISNGSRKYILNRQLYELKQNSASINDYYTQLQGLREEIDVMNVYPKTVSPTPDMLAFMATMSKCKEESRLFQFLNGLTESFRPQRSQILMLSPLPTVEAACALIQ